MSVIDAFIFAALSSIVGGAVGARMAKADAWRGAIVVVVWSLVSGLLVFFNEWLSILAGLIGAGITSGVLKLSGRQLASVILGAILFAFSTAFVAAFLGW